MSKDFGIALSYIWQDVETTWNSSHYMFKSHPEQNQTNMLFRWKQYILLKLLAEKVLCLLEPEEEVTKLMLSEYKYFLHDSCWKDSLLTPERCRHSCTWNENEMQMEKPRWLVSWKPIILLYLHIFRAKVYKDKHYLHDCKAAIAGKKSTYIRNKT